MLDIFYNDLFSNDFKKMLGNYEGLKLRSKVSRHPDNRCIWDDYIFSSIFTTVCSKCTNCPRCKELGGGLRNAGELSPTAVRMHALPDIAACPKSNNL